jgi:hypothetical protein
MPPQGGRGRKCLMLRAISGVGPDDCGQIDRLTAYFHMFPLFSRLSLSKTTENNTDHELHKLHEKTKAQRKTFYPQISLISQIDSFLISEKNNKTKKPFNRRCTLIKSPT